MKMAKKKHSKAFNEALKKAIHYLQTPEGKKEFMENRQRSIDLQAIIIEAKREVFVDIRDSQVMCVQYTEKRFKILDDIEKHHLNK